MGESASTSELELGSYSSALLVEEQSFRQVYFLTLISDVVSNTPNHCFFAIKQRVGTSVLSRLQQRNTYSRKVLMEAECTRSYPTHSLQPNLLREKS